ncbi:MAG: glycoside hydrolase family 44 protein [Cytophagaceae bacterium]
MIIFKYILRITFVLLILPVSFVKAQYQDKSYLKEFQKDFTSVKPAHLRDAYPVMKKGILNEMFLTSAHGTVSKIDPAGTDYKNIVEIKTLKEFNNEWDIELTSRNSGPILEGDVLLLSFYMKTIASKTDNKYGFARVYFQKPSPPWEKSFNEGITSDGQWRQYIIPVKSSKNYEPGEGVLSFALGFSYQTIQIADLHLLNLGANVRMNELPVQRFDPEIKNVHYEGSPISVSYKVNTKEDRKPISPLIYGTNGQSDDWQENITARRLGGNRYTTYNWENNASNAGHDWMHMNDNYLVWKPGLMNYGNIPGIPMTAFHDTSIAMNTYTLLTAQMAGYVAADKDGPVEGPAPSNRWVKVKASKGGTLSTNPDLNDGTVYMDEMVNFIIKKYGKSTGGKGVRGWALDNEPGLWNSSHSYLHPNPVTCQELFSKSKELSSVIKKLDPGVEIFGPMFWGYSDMYHLTDAPDWPKYKNKYPNFVAAYLDNMRAMSDTAGTRLLDVLAIHWYPEIRGLNNKGTTERVVNFNHPSYGSTDRGVCIARMNAVRSWWDPEFKENSWYTEFLPKPINLIPETKAAIDKYYPGTKLAFTEYNFGGFTHVSSGIANADAFGVFAKYGIYFASYWEPVQGYASSAFRLFRNYDGKKSTFGDTYVYSSTSDHVNSSVYSSIHQSDESKLHMIVLNKSFDNPINANIDINSSVQYKTATIYAFDNSTQDIKVLDTVEVKDNKLIYALPPLTAAHIILTK